jgi:XTP/dITP diphosphohydrolase
MSRHPLVLATRNAGKIEEFRRILEEIAPGTIELIGLERFPELVDVEETENTFEGNALLKARTVCKQTGLPAIADDSGLCIDALNGAPGIFSARWSGVHGNDAGNIEKVLGQLEGIPREERGAHFTCVSALVMPDGSETTQEGTFKGEILMSPLGTNGFGYDPIFRPDGFELSLAQLDAQQKDAISHRGQSLRAIAPRVALMLDRLG